MPPAMTPATPAPGDAALTTDFERDFQEKGIQTLRAAYRAMPL
ncbi:MAG: hypothetical protein ABSC18_05430 [Verrucomicrobiota bacterium]